MCPGRGCILEIKNEKVRCQSHEKYFVLKYDLKRGTIFIRDNSNCKCSKCNKKLNSKELENGS